MIYALLFYEFFLIGLLAVGGGAATIPFLFDLSEKYGWFSFQDLSDMIAVSEATPGPIGVNMATFAGFETAGVLGALVATTGLVLPSLMIIILLVKAVNQFSCRQVFDDVLAFVRPAVAALILNAAAQIGAVSLTSLMCAVMFVLFLILMRFYKTSPVFYIVLAGLLGYVLKL